MVTKTLVTQSSRSHKSPVTQTHSSPRPSSQPVSHHSQASKPPGIPFFLVTQTHWASKSPGKPQIWVSTPAGTPKSWSSSFFGFPTSWLPTSLASHLSGGLFFWWPTLSAPSSSLLDCLSLPPPAFGMSPSCFCGGHFSGHLEGWETRGGG